MEISGETNTGLADVFEKAEQVLDDHMKGLEDHPDDRRVFHNKQQYLTDPDKNSNYIWKEADFATSRPKASLPVEHLVQQPGSSKPGSSTPAPPRSSCTTRHAQRAAAIRG